MTPMETTRPWPTPAPAHGTAEFRSHVERFEECPWNASGTDKAWVEAIQPSRDDPWTEVVCDRPAKGARARLFGALASARVRYVVIGVGGADLHARRKKKEPFQTLDLDLFLPRDAANLVRAWGACERAGWTLWVGREPLDQPHDELIARNVVEQRARTIARVDGALPTDLTLVMGALDFEDVWLRRTDMYEEGEPVELARLADIVAAKEQANREKDHRFIAENRAVLDELLAAEGPPGLEL